MQGEGRSYRRLYEKIKWRNDVRPKFINVSTFSIKEAKIARYENEFSSCDYVSPTTLELLRHCFAHLHIPSHPNMIDLYGWSTLEKASLVVWNIREARNMWSFAKECCTTFQVLEYLFRL